MEVLNSGPDFREGVDSFVQKRPPAFRPLAGDFDPEKITGAPVPGARMTSTELLQRLRPMTESHCRSPGQQRVRLVEEPGERAAGKDGKCLLCLCARPAREGSQKPALARV